MRGQEHYNLSHAPVSRASSAEPPSHSTSETSDPQSARAPSSPQLGLRLGTGNVVNAVGLLRNTQAETDLLQLKAMFEAERKDRTKKRRTRGSDSITSISSVTSVVSVISVRSSSRTRRAGGVREEGTRTSSDNDYGSGTDAGTAREFRTTTERIERVEAFERRDRPDRRSSMRRSGFRTSSPERGARTRRAVEEMAHTVNDLERCIHELAISEDERRAGRAR